jgi:hypothetical protein
MEAKRCVVNFSRKEGKDQLRRERTGVGAIKVSEILDVACTRDGLNSKEAVRIRRGTADLRKVKKKARETARAGEDRRWRDQAAPKL